MSNEGFPTSEASYSRSEFAHGEIFRKRYSLTARNAFCEIFVYLLLYIYYMFLFEKKNGAILSTAIV